MTVFVRAWWPGLRGPGLWHGSHFTTGFLFQARALLLGYCLCQNIETYYHVRTRQKSGCLDTGLSGCRNNALSEFNRARGDSQDLEQSSSIRWCSYVSHHGAKREKLENKEAVDLDVSFWWVTSLLPRGCRVSGGSSVSFASCLIPSTQDRAWGDLRKHLLRNILNYISV